MSDKIKRSPVEKHNAWRFNTTIPRNVNKSVTGDKHRIYLQPDVWRIYIPERRNDKTDHSKTTQAQDILLTCRLNDNGYIFLIIKTVTTVIYYCTFRIV
ncbi:hypothetical protein Dda3937_01656 [Dickeya dadantii 3937]|uniref:Uncharacterized protein n=1 Tax=Dickeya dadantii (strain 3937) TaxID=198628 RepID=E0SM80_DICD3|nr:hypothetical protein Dda3937_01656 [Dickeya dadantii 3937]